MPILETRVDPRAESFRRNREENLRLLGEVRALEAAVRRQAERARERFARRGQLLPRERVGRLLDPGAPFLELSTLAGLGLHDDDGHESVTGGATIVAIGQVAGLRCLVIADDSAIKGGAISPMGLRKRLRAQEIARRNRLPLINLVESAGANLNYQAEIFVEGGRTFANLARLSAAGIPVLSVVHGSSTAGGAYLPGLSDYVIAVRGRAKIFLGGPPLVKAAIGQDADDESLGGAELHATVTGLSEYLAEDDGHALELAREVIAKLGWEPAAAPAREARPPRHDSEEILGIVSSDYRVPYDAREVMARLVDDSDFLEWKALYGPHTVCGHASVDGPRLRTDRQQRSPRHRRFDQGRAVHPTLLPIGHTAGLLPEHHRLHGGEGRGAEGDRQARLEDDPGGRQRHRSPDHTPHRRLVRGRQLRHVRARLRSAVPLRLAQRAHRRDGWRAGGRRHDPNHRGEVAARGQVVDTGALDRMRTDIVERLERESTALYSTARLWDDGIIDPRDSRRVLGFALATCRDAERRELHPSTFGVARF